MNLGCIKPLCDLLTVMDSKIVQVALNGLENILRLGEQEAKQENSGAGVNPYCSLIEEAYGQLTHSLTHSLLVHTHCWSTHMHTLTLSLTANTHMHTTGPHTHMTLWGRGAHQRGMDARKTQQCPVAVKPVWGGMIQDPYFLDSVGL